MDEYSVTFIGCNMDLRVLQKVFDTYSVVHASNKHDRKPAAKGRGQAEPKKWPAVVSSVVFSTPETNLLNFLESLSAQVSLNALANIEEIQIWALMERQDQINGELSGEEIQRLASLKASFNWSVILQE